jgi:hypothetical protein
MRVASLIASMRGETVSDVLRRALDTYIAEYRGEASRRAEELFLHTAGAAGALSANEPADPPIE